MNIGLIRNIVTPFIMASVLYACDSADPTVPNETRMQRAATFDRSEKPVIMTITFHDTDSQLEDAYEEATGRRDPPEYGFARYNMLQDAEGNLVEPDMLFCNIHTKRPRRVDDDNMLTLGHEVLHCLWGEFHGKENNTQSN